MLKKIFFSPRIFSLTSIQFFYFCAMNAIANKKNCKEQNRRKTEQKTAEKEVTTLYYWRPSSFCMRYEPYAVNSKSVEFCALFYGPHSLFTGTRYTFFGRKMLWPNWRTVGTHGDVASCSFLVRRRCCSRRCAVCPFFHLSHFLQLCFEYSGTTTTDFYAFITLWSFADCLSHACLLS